MIEYNWKWGETCPICVRAAEDSEIKIGDLLWLDSDGKAQSASTFSKSETLAETQKAFTLDFLGVAMQASPAGRKGTIRAATCGTFEFDDETSGDVAQHIGSFVGINLNSHEERLDPKSVITVDSSLKAIGRIVHQENVPAGKAYVAIVSTVLKGGVPGSDPKHKTE